MNRARYYPGVSTEEMLRAFERTYLEGKGWLRSVDAREPVDGVGPIPWITYPALEQLKRIVRSDFRILEFGSGGSTEWWADRVTEVVSIEHDVRWAKEIGKRLGGRATVLHVAEESPAEALHASFVAEFFGQGLEPATTDDPERDRRAGLPCRSFVGYATQLLRYPCGYFDVVVVDGMARALTAWLAARRVAAGGFVLFDNSDRTDYQAGYRALEEAGFARLDYWGPGPINPYEWCTSLFTRSLDVFRGAGEFA